MGWDTQTERGRDLLDTSSGMCASERDDGRFAERGRDKAMGYRNIANMLTQRVAGELVSLMRYLVVVWGAVKAPPQQKRQSSTLLAMAVSGQPVPLTIPAPSERGSERQERALRKVRSGA